MHSRRGLGRLSAKHFNVVPANAGTHNHRSTLLKKAVALCALSAGHGVWVPAPVRNCALGRDDGDRVARRSIPITMGP
jgi:hypothetical protein